MKNVRIAEISGFCFGVERALNLALDASKSGRAETLGPIIHNPAVVKELSAKGVSVQGDIKNVKSSSLVIRAHGIPPDIYESAKKMELKLYDGTCPYVRIVQRMAEKLYREGYTVVIVGKKEHPEIKGVLGFTENKGIVVSSSKELDSYDFRKKRVGIVVQTTFRFDIFQKIVNNIMRQAIETRVFHTRCYDTETRQNAVIKLAKKVEVMIIIGGKRSSNTRKLFELSKQYSLRAYHIESLEEIENSWFDGITEIGLAGGASTPDETVEKIKEYILSL